jgi:hypothetical protein
LKANDDILLTFCCRTILESEFGNPYVPGQQLVAYGKGVGLNAQIVEEAVHVLENAAMLSARFSLGSGNMPDIVEPTRYGMEMHLGAYFPNYNQALREVASRILNHGEHSDWAISKATSLPPRVGAPHPN